jgi:hypothetical protein
VTLEEREDLFSAWVFLLDEAEAHVISRRPFRVRYEALDLAVMWRDVGFGDRVRMPRTRRKPSSRRQTILTRLRRGPRPSAVRCSMERTVTGFAGECVNSKALRLARHRTLGRVPRPGRCRTQ